MSDRFLSHLERAQAYADCRGILLHREEPFGYGMDGTVWRTSRHTVIKSFEKEKNFSDELECFGKRWATVLSLLRQLESYGIWYVDPKPGNVMFPD